MNTNVIYVDFKTKAIVKKENHKSKVIFQIKNLLAEKFFLEKHISPRLKIYNHRNPL